MNLIEMVGDLVRRPACRVNRRSSASLIGVLVAVALALCGAAMLRTVPSPAATMEASAAVPDRDFGGGDGAILLKSSAKGREEYIFSGMAIDSRDRVVIAYQLIPDNDAEAVPLVWVVRRFLPNGGTDRRFGRNGLATVKLPVPKLVGWGAMVAGPRVLVLGPDDEVILAGDVSYDVGDHYLTKHFGVARLTASGKADRRFGGDGFIRFRGRRSRDRTLTGAVVQASGRIVILGNYRSTGEVSLIRLNSNGTRDRHFGARSGTALVTTGTGSRWSAGDLELLPGDALAVAAFEVDSTSRPKYRVRVADFSRDGISRKRFGDEGAAIVSRPGSAHLFPFLWSLDLEVDETGLRYLLFNVRPVGGNVNDVRPGVVRLDSKGTVDRGYGGDGLSIDWPAKSGSRGNLDLGSPSGGGRSDLVLRHGDGTGGACPATYAVVPLDPAGRLDATWAGGGGPLCTKFGVANLAGDPPSAITRDSRGRVVAAGIANTIDGREISPTIFIARFTTSP